MTVGVCGWGNLRSYIPNIFLVNLGPEMFGVNQI